MGIMPENQHLPNRYIYKKYNCQIKVWEEIRKYGTQNIIIHHILK